jgi:hypothetical protein
MKEKKREKLLRFRLGATSRQGAEAFFKRQKFVGWVVG